MSSIEQTATTGLRFVVDPDLCAGHGRCYALDPEHFDSDEVGYAVVLDRVDPLSSRGAMEDVAAACPEEAITIAEVPATA